MSEKKLDTYLYLSQWQNSFYIALSEYKTQFEIDFYIY